MVIFPDGKVYEQKGYESHDCIILDAIKEYYPELKKELEENYNINFLEDYSWQKYVLGLPYSNERNILRIYKPIEDDGEFFYGNYDEITMTEEQKRTILNFPNEKAYRLLKRIITGVIRI